MSSLLAAFALSRKRSKSLLTVGKREMKKWSTSFSTALTMDTMLTSARLTQSSCRTPSTCIRGDGMESMWRPVSHALNSSTIRDPRLWIWMSPSDPSRILSSLCMGRRRVLRSAYKWRTGDIQPSRTNKKSNRCTSDSFAIDISSGNLILWVLTYKG